MKARSTANGGTDPVWCHHCSLRIAPYGAKTVRHGKNYHRDCYAKVTHLKSQVRKS